MNCFNCINHYIDYLEKNLPSNINEAVKKHISICKKCRKKYNHYFEIISIIQSFPKIKAPNYIQSQKLISIVPDLFKKFDFKTVRYSWLQRIPWFIRIPIEGIGLICIVLSIVIIIPKIRSFYEKKLENRLEEPLFLSLENEQIITEKADNNEHSNQKNIKTNLNKHNDAPLENIIPTEITEKTTNSSQLWRFTLKTVSPEELKPEIIKILSTLQLNQYSHLAEGIEVPGGIEFELNLPSHQINELKNALQKLSAASALNDFSWYRIYTKKNTFPDQSTAVIWLTQPSIYSTQRSKSLPKTGQTLH